MTKKITIADRRRIGTLKELRKSMGYTQEHMAHFMEMSLSQYQRKEREYDFNLSEIELISNLLNTSIYDLI